MGGLGPGAPVQFRGIRIGSVTDVRLEVDTTSDRIRIPVTLELEPQRLVSDEEVQHAADQRYRYMAELVKRGLRAQLKTGNLLTGELMVDLTFVPGATPAELDTQGPVAIIPSVPNTLDQLQASVGQMLDRIAKLPVDDLVTSLTGTARKLDALVASPSVQEAVDSLGPSVAQFQRVLQRIDVEAGPILESVKRTSGDASAALREARTTMVSVRGTVGPQSELKDDTQDLLRELTRAAQSIRSFADYLDRHPEALVRGKGGRP